MHRATLLAALLTLAAPMTALAVEDVSVERGLYISVIGGCHDCHTAGYSQAAGKIDPAKAFLGKTDPMKGPWGATFPMNLRITAADKTEDQFLEFARTFKTRPPMPWFNIHAMHEADIRSLYRYIKSLGEPGEQVPEAIPPE